MDLAVVALTFAAIFVVELPDKTFIAALVLSTRYRPLLVWLGVGLAVLSGRVLLRYMRLSLLHYIGAAVCVVLAGITLYELLG